MDSVVPRDPLSETARTIRPLLNRIVFTGIHASRFLHSAERQRVRRPVAASSTIPAIATVALDRLAPELLAAGLERTRRGGEREEWLVPGQGRLKLTAASETGTSADTLALEYAVLLTRTVVLATDLTVRVTVPAIQLLLSWADHRASRAAFTESADVEDMLEIVAGHADLLAEVEALPGELRDAVAHAAGILAAHESCGWVLRRALPDARSAPGVVGLVQARLRRIVALGAAAAA